ncbi:MAG: ABC transporter substrate-binding protein [Bacteroidota bacterium]|nr:ABC transporter substrate-binding protein [Bacteroidota bacterium]
MKINFLILFTMLCCMGCTNSSRKQNIPDKTTCKATEISYAKGFRIHRFKEYTQLTVRNPWDTTRILDTYILVDRNKKIPAKLPAGTVVRIPVERVAFASSVHAGMWNQLNKAQLTVGVCEPEYFSIPIITEGLKSGKIADLGMATSINTEKLIAASPEILIVSPFEDSKHTEFEKVEIAVVKDASYMEELPLGRAEWIKFEAAFTNESELADKIFSKIEKNYIALCRKVATTQERPTVFTEKKYGDSWYIAGGNSYLGRFMRDAGASYLWKELNQSGSAPFTFEKVYAKAINADYWLLKYNDKQGDMNYESLKNEYNLYANFNAFKQKHVFAINTAKTPFYETGPLEPDRVLADLVHIFHPGLLPGYKPKYYFNLEKDK